MKIRYLPIAVLAAFSGNLYAHQAGDIIFRAGIANVSPNEGSDDVAGLGEFEIDSNTQLGLNFTYMLSDNMGIELLAATPFAHDVSLPSIGKIAELKHLPPTLMGQYYFGSGALRPYVGAGVNMTIFFDEKFTNDLNGALSNIDIDTSFGLAAQVGVDYYVNQNWLVNASIWYLDITTDVDFKLSGNDVSIDTDVDPLVYMVSLGYKF